ncbi:hypothetical protein ACFQ5F_09915 [Kroppenstedtia eburnea]|uniref:Uncharacterized protein n=1 Tax=Kroppenstedtia eburnea TaxID=714067 RepID=A0A1N7JFR8_9BACL|nr:hypothetical protein [Kroppenstedtia eburnea]QKI80584.1 hypothetical protein GXN75_00290 [Kroppenstedtia eburnea]SIS48159.1 hypothetical protein SAMN05421790_10239 [Kroppenstedtia eburnea]
MTDMLTYLATAGIYLANPENSSLWGVVNNFSDWLRPNLKEAYFLVASVLILIHICVRQLRPRILNIIGWIALAGLFVLGTDFLETVVEFLEGLATRKG